MKRTSKSSTSFSALGMVTMAAPDSARRSCLQQKALSLSLPDSLPHVDRLPFEERPGTPARNAAFSKRGRVSPDHSVKRSNRIVLIIGFTQSTPSSFASRSSLFMHEPQGAAMRSACSS